MADESELMKELATAAVTRAAHGPQLTLLCSTVETRPGKTLRKTMATSMLSPIAVLHRVGSAARRVLTTAGTWIIHP